MHAHAISSGMCEWKQFLLEAKTISESFAKQRRLRWGVGCHICDRFSCAKTAIQSRCWMPPKKVQNYSKFTLIQRIASKSSSFGIGWGPGGSFVADVFLLSSFFFFIGSYYPLCLWFSSSERLFCAHHRQHHHLVLIFILRGVESNYDFQCHALALFSTSSNPSPSHSIP